MSQDIEQLINPGQLRLLLAVVDAQSFSGAANALGVSQPSISQQVRRLERLSGRRLFRRTPKGVGLTSDGEALVVYARAILGLTDDLRRHFRQTQDTVRLTLGMSEDFCRTALPNVMRLFMLDHPMIEMRIVCGTTETLTAAVNGKAVDFAVMRREPEGPGGETLWARDLAWIGRSDCRFPVADPVPLVAPIAPNFLRDTLIDALKAGGRSWRVAFESHGFAALESGVQAGLGVCALPHGMPLFGTVMLGPGCGLPPLPRVEYVLCTPVRAPSEPALAFAGILKACAASSFAPPDSAPTGEP